jgi:hypothetical protein
MGENLHDEAQSWILHPDGSWKRVLPGAKPQSAHVYFMVNPSLSGRGSAVHGHNAYGHGAYGYNALGHGQRLRISD